MLIIFDCDGVLLDSEPLAAKAFHQALSAHDIPLTEQECHDWFVGRTLADCFNIIESKGFTLPEGFHEKLRDIEAPLFEQYLEPTPGIVSVLETLKSKAISFCVASNSGLDKLHSNLAITGLKPFFGENIFSADHVEKGKPAPDLFLHAADTMGVPAKFCTVIEDSDAGIAAAKSASMRVLQFIPKASSSAVENQFKAMEDLIPLLFNH